MFNSISWQGYWITVALLTAVYYLAVYFLYFSKDSKTGLQQGFMAVGSVPSLLQKEATERLVREEDEEYLFDCCLNELAAFFEEAKAIKWVKEELIFSLQRLLKKYTALKNSRYKESINKVIVCQSETSCSMQLAEGDLVHVWLEV